MTSEATLTKTIGEGRYWVICSVFLRGGVLYRTLHCFGNPEARSQWITYARQHGIAIEEEGEDR